MSKADWKEVTLDELLTHQIGGAWGEAPGKKDVDVLAFGTKAFVNGAKVLDPSSGTMRSISQKQYDTRELKQGDIILEVSGGSDTQPVGRTLFVEADMPNVVPSSFFRLLRFNSNKVEPLFMSYEMQHLYNTGVTKLWQANTTGIRNLKVPRFLEHSFPLPPLEVQRQIVAVMQSIDQAISDQETHVKATEKVRENTLHALLAKGGDDWEETTLGEVSNKLRYGYIGSANDEGKGYRFVRQTDIKHGYIDWGGVPHVDNGKDDVEKFLVQEGDILISRLGNGVGNATYVQSVPEGAIFAGYLVRAQIYKEKAIPALVGYVLRSSIWWNYINRVVAGSAKPTLNAQKMSAFSFPLPPLDEQQRIVAVMQSIDSHLADARGQLESMRNLRGEVLNALLSGEHEIPADFDPTMRQLNSEEN